MFDEYLKTDFRFVEENYVPIMYGFYTIGGTLMGKTTAVLVQLFFLSICIIIWYELEMLRKRMKRDFEHDHWLASRELIIRYKNQYELIIDLVEASNKMLGKHYEIYAAKFMHVKV